MDNIRVLLVEDDPVWVRNLTKFLSRQKDILVIGVASSKEEAIRLAQSLEFDVILMDINLDKNKYDGIYAAMEILEIKKAKIIMLTCIMEDSVITNSFAAGAVNYVSKENYQDIPNVIRMAYKNKSPIEALLNEFSRLKKEEQLKDLSPCEREIFDLIEQGYTRSQIEEKLLKTRNTLKVQIKKILSKLGVSSSKEAVHKVKYKGIKPEEDSDLRK
ncbi:MAG: response regulator [Bacillota bacterium]